MLREIPDEVFQRMKDGNIIGEEGGKIGIALLTKRKVVIAQVTKIDDNSSPRFEWQLCSPNCEYQLLKALDDEPTTVIFQLPPPPKTTYLITAKVRRQY